MSASFRFAILATVILTVATHSALVQANTPATGATTPTESDSATAQAPATPAQQPAAPATPAPQPDPRRVEPTPALPPADQATTRTTTTTTPPASSSLPAVGSRAKLSTNQDLRSAGSATASSLRMLETGSEVTVLETADGFVRVRTPSGEGWLPASAFAGPAQPGTQAGTATATGDASSATSGTGVGQTAFSITDNTAPAGSATLQAGDGTTLSTRPAGPVPAPRSDTTGEPGAATTLNRGSATLNVGSATTNTGSATTNTGSATLNEGNATTIPGATSSDASNLATPGQTAQTQVPTPARIPAGTASSPDTGAATTLNRGSATLNQGNATTNAGSTASGARGVPTPGRMGPMPGPGSMATQQGGLASRNTDAGTMGSPGDLATASLDGRIGTEVLLRSPAHLASQPSGGAAPLSRLPLGTPVTVLAQQGEWIQVSTAARTGWVRSSDLNLVPDATSGVGRDAFGQATLATGSLLSDRPGIDGTSSAQLPAGSQVTILDQHVWLNVRTVDGMQGWIRSDVIGAMPGMPSSRRETFTVGASALVTAAGSLAAQPAEGSPIIGPVVAGARVTVLELQDDFVRVRTSQDIEGWLPRASLDPSTEPSSDETGTAVLEDR